MVPMALTARIKLPHLSSPINQSPDKFSKKATPAWQK